MRDYRYLFCDLDWCYKNQTNQILAKETIRKEWRLRSQEFTNLQADLNELEVPIPDLLLVQMWQHVPPQFDIMEKSLLRIRLENNIMAIRRVQYRMLAVFKRFQYANRKCLSVVDEEAILSTNEYLSNSDEE